MAGLLDYFNRGTSALTGSTGNYGGLLSDEEQKAAQQQAQLAMAAQLLDAGGWSPNRTSFGQALGRGIAASGQARQSSVDQSLQAALLRKQLEAAGQKDRGRLIPVVGANGKPVLKFESDAEGMSPYDKQGGGDGVGDYQPGNYTEDSWAKFAEGGYKDPSVLKRYITPRQEYSPSFQSITRTLPDGSTQYGTFDTRSGTKVWDGEIVPPGKKTETEAAGRERGKITGAREGKAPVAYDTFKAGIASLEKAMSETATGPVAGRFPAFTAAQQTAEGAEAIMAPVLKQLFRDAGEGTFTDSDQALLMKMVPNRKDHPEARKAKIEMIDSIVRAKLGLDNVVGSTAPSEQPKRVRVDAQGNVIGN